MAPASDLPDRDFFQQVLRKALKNPNVQLAYLTSQPVCATGDSYTSNIKRVFLNYQLDSRKHVLPVIFKVQVRGTIVEDWTIELDFFRNEIAMFSTILPALNTILANGGRGERLNSDCYLATHTPDFTLVLEDLQPLGYRMMERTIGLDMSHTECVLHTLARLHAGSVALLQAGDSQLGRHMERFSKGLFSASKVSTKWMADGLRSLIKTCKSMADCCAVGAKLEAIGVDEAIARTLKAAERSHEQQQLNVLNHGDMWLNNMLFLHDGNDGNDDERVVDLKLIDFQLVKYTSPALDLHYFYATSMQNDVREQLERLLDYYYAHLVQNLMMLKCKLLEMPTRREMQRDFEERAFYGVIALATVTPLVKAPPHKDANFDQLSKDDDDPNGFREFIYACDAYKCSVRQLMKYYDSLGIFD